MIHSINTIFVLTLCLSKPSQSLNMRVIVTIIPNSTKNTKISSRVSSVRNLKDQTNYLKTYSKTKLLEKDISKMKQTTKIYIQRCFCNFHTFENYSDTASHSKTDVSVYTFNFIKFFPTYPYFTSSVYFFILLHIKE